MNMFKALSLSAAAVLALSSCTSRILDLDVCSANDLDFSGNTQYVTADAVKVKGVSRRHTILIFPLGFPKLSEAARKAIAEGGPHAVALANVKVDATGWWIPYLYGQSVFTLEGNPILKKTAPAAPAPQPQGGKQ